MVEQICIIAYDHDEDLGACAVCGWRPDSLNTVNSNGDVVAKIQMLNAWMRDNCHGGE